MNILLINHYAGSLQHGMEYRPYYLGRGWVRFGHQVVIATASISHLRLYSPLITGPITKETIDGIQYLWFQTSKYHGNNLGRAINIFSFVGILLRYSDWIAKSYSPDVVIASSTYPLDIIPASWIASKVNAKLVFEVHDLWPLHLIEVGGMSQKHPLVLLFQWAADYAYRNADHVVSILPNASEYMESRGMEKDKFVYVPNGIDIGEWQISQQNDLREHKRIIYQLQQKKLFLVGYAGAHGLSNALHTIIQAASRIQTQPIAFILIGEGPEKKKLQRSASELGLNNVLFLPPIPKSSIPALLNEMDALYIGLKKEPLFRYGVCPNKLMDYMMAAKPIIYAIEAGNDMVAENNCGISIPSEHPVALMCAIIKLINTPADERSEMGKRGKRYVLANHDYQLLAKKFLAPYSTKQIELSAYE